MEKDKLDWYSYLTEEFRGHRDSYTVSDRVVFTCPRCGKTDVVRINHAKAKIKRLGIYECSKCRKTDSIHRARAKCSEKYGGKNPFAEASVREKIKKTNLERYGVECILHLERIQVMGRIAAAEKRKKNRGTTKES